MKIKQNLSEPLGYRYIVIGVYAKKIKFKFVTWYTSKV